ARRDGASPPDRLTLSDEAKARTAPVDKTTRASAAKTEDPATSTGGSQAKPPEVPSKGPEGAAKAPEAAGKAQEVAPGTPEIAVGPKDFGLCGGAGDLSPDLRWDIGDASIARTGPSLGYVGMDYSKTFGKDLGHGNQAGLTLHPTVLRTFTGGEASGKTTAQV